MKYKITGIITIPAGIAQADELKIDSPIVELQPSTISNEGVTFGILYTYMQGSIEQKLSLNHFIPNAELEVEELKAIEDIIIKASQRLFKMYPNAKAVE